MVLSECKTEKGNSQLEHGQPIKQTSDLFCMWDLGNTSFTSGERVQCSVSLAAINQICVIYEAMNGCKNLKIYLRIALKNVNIFEWPFYTGFTQVLLR